MRVEYSPSCRCWWVKNDGDVILAEFSSKEKAVKYITDLLVWKLNKNI
jgi:hypothetical protein|tara:strand:- start:529 stop:672 length:144 start_codon:yes stop_codon:yes gene_type:complete